MKTATTTDAQQQQIPNSLQFNQTSSQQQLSYSCSATSIPSLITRSHNNSLISRQRSSVSSRHHTHKASLVLPQSSSPSRWNVVYQSPCIPPMSSPPTAGEESDEGNNNDIMFNSDNRLSRSLSTQGMKYLAKSRRRLQADKKIINDLNNNNNILKEEIQQQQKSDVLPPLHLGGGSNTNLSSVLSPRIHLVKSAAPPRNIIDPSSLITASPSSVHHTTTMRTADAQQQQQAISEIPNSIELPASAYTNTITNNISYLEIDTTSKNDKEDNSKPLTPMAEAQILREKECRKRKKLTTKQYNHLQAQEMYNISNSIRLEESAVNQVKFQLPWKNVPDIVMVFKPQHDDVELLKEMTELCNWLDTKCGVSVHVEPYVALNELKQYKSIDHIHTTHIQKQQQQQEEEEETINNNNTSISTNIDFCICLGGDAGVLQCSLFFQSSIPIPPVIGFTRRGESLGFLTPFAFEEYKRHLGKVLDHHNPLYLCPHMRLFCQIFRNEGDGITSKKPDISMQILNDVLVTRGMSPYLTQLNLWVDGKPITRIQADGVIISTPTGSTGSAMRAGGSVVAPCVPAICITPVCPHSLSFRPLLLPDCSRIHIQVPVTSKGSSWIRMDGEGDQIELKPGDYVFMQMSPWTIPAILMTEFNAEWFDSINSRLLWNVNMDHNFSRPQVTTVTQAAYYT